MLRSRMPALAVGVLLIAGCGSSSHAPGVSTAPSAGTTPAGAADPSSGKPSATRPAARSVKVAAKAGAIHRDTGAVKARRRKGPNTDAANRTGANGVNPCELVTRSEAVAIVGKAVAKPQLGAQGPTCIYDSRAAKQFVTLAIVQMTPAALNAGRRGAVNLQVAGHKAVCVNLGGQQLRVPLVDGKVLNVAGPCPIATGFARKALSRLVD